MSFSYTQPYIVVGAFIVRDGKVLLVQENHPPDKGKWNIPAGKLDFGENPLDTVKREAFEEAGIDFDPTYLLGIHSIYRKDVPGEVHAFRVIFCGEAKNDVSLEHGEAVDGIAEIADYKWLKLKEVLSIDDKLFRYHDIKDLTRNYLDKTQCPLSLIRHIVQTRGG
ncbi:MAG TPA: NUDIX domain-containing protein [Candidatus Saccharimonadales bacterium]|nr:NUDIX domain-containing protein [Candidatus Saccharimonadales bacterium]